MPAHPCPAPTPRTVLRPWKASDRAPFQCLNADAEVMTYFPAPLTAVQSDALAARIQERLLASGFGFWALEERASGAFIGFVGLSVPSFTAAFMPCIEIGWRLARPYWGQGLAAEAAHAVLRFGFDTLALDEIVAFTARLNLRSQRLMQRLGMHTRAADDFDHPGVAAASPLRPHVLYRLERNAFAAERHTHFC